jgi:hypothetical protein
MTSLVPESQLPTVARYKHFRIGSRLRENAEAKKAVRILFLSPGNLKAKLASFKVPRAFLFFREEEFAITGSEKVKTDQLRELAASRLKG